MIISASTVTVSSCKDYDDDIAGLQEQVDSIKNNKDAVTITELNSAIQAIKDEYNKQISDLNDKLLNVVSKEEFQALQSKLDELNKKLESTASKEEVVALTEQIDALEKQLENVATEDQVKGLQEQIDALEKKLDNLEGLQGRIEALEEANRLFKEGGDLSAYNGLKQFINDQITAALGNDGAIAEYINNTVKNSILTEIKGNYDGTLDDLDAALKAVDEKYDKLLGENGTIINDIEELQLYRDAIEDALGKEGQEGADALKALLEEVNSNIGALSALLTGEIPEGLETSIKAIVDTEFTSINTKIDTIESELDKLGLEVAAIKAMVKSIVFIPSFDDSKVVFENVQFRKTSNGAYETKYHDNSQTVRFRISPKAAADKLAENYHIKIYDDGHVATRSGANYQIVEQDGSLYLNEGNGIVSIKLKALNDNASRALAIALEPKEKGNVSNDYDNITSDYFIAQTKTLEIKDVKYVYSNPNNMSTIYWNPKNDEPEKGYTIFNSGKWMLTFSDNSTRELTEGDLVKAEDFTLSYSVEDNKKTIFTVDSEGKVSLKSPNISNVDQETEVYSTVKMTGWYIDSQNSKIKLGKVKVESLAEEVYADNQTFEYNGKVGNLTSFTINVKNLLIREQFDEAFINDILRGTPTTETKLSVYGNNAQQNVTISQSGDILTVTLPSKTVSGEHDIKVSYASSTSQTKVNVNVKVTVKEAVLPYLLSMNKVPERWNGDIVTLNPISSGTNINYSGYKFDSMFKFGTYTDFNNYMTQINALGGEVVVSQLSHEGYQGIPPYTGITFNYTSNEFTINPSTYSTKVSSSLTIKTIYGDKSDVVKIIVAVANVNGSWNIGQETAFNMKFKNGGTSDPIITNIEWKDALGNSMWKNGNWNTNYSSHPGFDVRYKVDAKDIEMVKRYIDNIDAYGYLTLTADQKLQFKNAADVSFTKFDFKVIVEVVAPFGDVQGYEIGKNTISITVEP